jgi:putative heme-binding domain-containing protein
MKKSMLSVLMLPTVVVTISFTNFAVSSFVQKESETLADWTLLQVPGTWDENASDIHKEYLTGYDGYAWYRCLITIPRRWKEKELQLHVDQVDDAHEAYFNGVKIGSAGSFPPNYKSGLAESNRYVVPAKLVQPGKNVLIAIRIFDHDGRGGFKGAAPTLINGKSSINLNGVWEFRTGDDLSWAKGPAKLTDTGIFWRALDTEIALENARNTGALTPEQAFKTFAIPDDLELELVLAEPVVKQPLFMDFDERGRMWLVQYLQYPNPAGLKMVSKDQYWRAVYDKIPPPPPNHYRGADKITIHEDTNGDGIFDTHKTFLDGLNIATSFAKGRGGVWVLNPPYLLFYPDRNNDDVPDGDPQVHLQGFGMEDTHSVANNIRWGPDGWLYAAQGSTVSGNISRPGDKKAVHSMGQLIWRYHPETKRYEIFAEGGGNAHGVEIDEKGRVFSGHNGGNTRGFHYVQGGYLRKGFSKHGPLSNPYSFGFFNAMKHHDVPRFTHMFILYAGDALPSHYNGKLFGVEPLQGRVVQSDFQPDRSSYQTKDINRPISTSDRRFRPVSIKVGPDGAIYVADMYEPQISHREHFSGQIEKNNGRIYRLQAKGAKPHHVPDLSKLSSRELVTMLDHPNKWYRQITQRLLADRKDRSIIPLLKRKISENTGQIALECLWALYVSGGFHDDVAMQTLDHEDQFVRIWTVRLLCDAKKVSKPIAEKLAEMSLSESYVQVRSQLAASAKRLSAADALPIVRNLLTHSEDVNDIHLPLLLWWAIESKADAGRDAVVAMFQDKRLWSLPLVQTHILNRVIQRYAMAGIRKDLLTCAQLFALAPGKKQTAELMKGFEQAFKGRSLAGLPVKLSEELSKAGGGSLTFRVRQGDEQAVSKALDVVADSKADTNTRIEYAQVFGEVHQPNAVAVLLKTLAASKKEDQLRMTILTALQSYRDEEIGSQVVKLYSGFSEDVQSTAHTLFVSRKLWNRQFLEAINAGQIDKKTIPLDAVRKMTIHQDDTIAELVRKHWKNVEGASSAEMQQQLAHLTGVLSNGSGDPYRGKELYSKSCAKCHLLFGQGGRIGPDLTSYKRDDSLRILLNVVNPSAEIREGFETFLVLTEDGRTVSGFLFDQDNRVLVLRGADGQNITIRQNEIDEKIPQKKSLMPEGLLKDLSEQQVRDLFAYLKSSQPLNN